jgi:capsular exopolysaccharide synthesis family protein
LISTIPKLPENGSGRKLLGPKKDPNSRQLLEPSQSNLVAQESYQRLQIYLNYGFIDKEVRSLVVSSSGPGEGKSSTAANFAVTLANSGKKVLLVDMDLRKPVVHKFFDLPQTPTLIHYLYKKCELGDIIKKTSINNLFVVTAVEFNQNPALVFTSPALREFMDKMKTRFDFVIYDTPPVNAVTDAIHLARLVDETILIARADQTNVDELNRAAKLFEQFNINVGGVVLNDFDDAKLPSYYGRYYGFYTKDGVKIKKKRKKDKKDVIFDN